MRYSYKQYSWGVSKNIEARVTLAFLTIFTVRKIKSKSKADCFLPDPVKKPHTQCLLWNVGTDPTRVEMKEHWPKVCFSKVMVLAWEYWLAKMLSPEKINPMCTTIYLKRHVKAEEDIFFIASMITKVKQIMGGYFLSCVYDSLRLWKIELSTEFIAARQLNNNQPRILPANYLLGQGRETRYK